MNLIREPFSTYYAWRTTQPQRARGRYILRAWRSWKTQPLWKRCPVRIAGSNIKSSRNYGTERKRQKLLVAGTGALVNISTPPAPAVLVTCGTQLTGDRLKVRSNA
jgi:hypothetical protein